MVGNRLVRRFSERRERYHARMPTARFDGVEIHYEIIGDDRPRVAVFSSGRHSLSDLEEMARHIASRGFRVDRSRSPQLWSSSISLDRPEPEEDVWTDDLRRLLDHLDWGPVFVVGKSRGAARSAIRFAERHSGAARGLLLWGLTGGQVAGRCWPTITTADTFGRAERRWNGGRLCGRSLRTAHRTQAC